MTGDRTVHITCMNNLKQVGLAIMQYAMDHQDSCPGTLADLEPYVGDKRVLYCPAMRKKREQSALYPYLLPPGTKLKDIKEPSRTSSPWTTWPPPTRLCPFSAMAMSASRARRRKDAGGHRRRQHLILLPSQHRQNKTPPAQRRQKSSPAGSHQEVKSLTTAMALRRSLGFFVGTYYPCGYGTSDPNVGSLHIERASALCL